MNTYTNTATLNERLNGLLEKTYDAEKGYKKAAENTENSNLKAFFTKKSMERKDFGHALKAEINTFGNTAEKGGSGAAAAHRTWMDIKAFFAEDNDEAMLEEAIRGEKAAVNEYEDVLADTTLPPSTSRVLKQQVTHITSDLSNIKRLEDLQ